MYGVQGALYGVYVSGIYVCSCTIRVAVCCVQCGMCVVACMVMCICAVCCEINVWLLLFLYLLRLCSRI